MKLGELKRLIDRAIEMDRDAADLIVTIPVKREHPAVGPRHCVLVKSAHRGIDWERHRFELYPDEQLHARREDA